MAYFWSTVLVVFSAVLQQTMCKLDCIDSSSDTETLRLSSPSDTVHLLVTENIQEASTTALCHVLCINKILEPELNFNNTMNGTFDGMNSSLASNNMGVFHLKCNQFRQYLDCRTGCIEESMNNCEICYNRCQSICGVSFLGCFGFDGNRCGVNCDMVDCNEGCQQFLNIPSALLPQPINSPVLIQLGSQKIFDVIVPSELELYNNPSLIFRIKTELGQYVYQWMVDIIIDLPEVTLVEYLLDLNPFIGQTVNISLGFATELGVSEYSQPIAVHLFNQIVPISPSDSVHRAVTESSDVAENIALCHVSCINFAITNATSELTGIDESNCQQFTQYLDCRTGCIEQSIGQANCIGICADRCQDICGSDLGCFGYNGNRCGVSCDNDNCSSGCLLFSQFSSKLLPPPLQPPHLIRMPLNMYEIITPDELEMYNHLSYVFQIETENGDIYYQWMVNANIDLPHVILIEYMLDLSSYAGQELKIAYAYATTLGLSKYSNKTLVKVPEKCVAVALTVSEIDIGIEQDEREGFFTHYVLNVTWCPTSCIERVSHYIITRNPDGGICGGTVTQTFDASTSNVILQSNIQEIVNLPCQQTVQIETVLIDGSIQEVARVIFLPTIGSNDLPNIEVIDCHVMFDSITELYWVDFQFTSPFSPAVLSHIEIFLVRVDSLKRLIDNPFQDFTFLEIGLLIDQIMPNINDTAYNYGTFLTPFEDVNQFYRLSVNVIWMVPPGPSRSAICDTIDTPAPPPEPIQTINIIEVENVSVVEVGFDAQQVTAAVILEWEVPELQLSTKNIEQYEIYLGTVPLEPDEAGSPITIINGDIQFGSVLRVFENVPLTQTTVTAFLQIRSRQFINIPSNWSEAQEITIALLSDLRLYSVIGEPLFTVPISDTQHLCYEIYGDMDLYFNYISTACVSVNVHYKELATDLVGETRPLHLIDEVAIHTVDNSGNCINILVDRNGCTTSVNGAFNRMYSDEGVILSAIGNRVSVNVPNCYSMDIKMEIICETINRMDIIRLEIMKAFDKEDSSHGLLGQFWNVEISIEEFNGLLQDGSVDDNFKSVTLTPSLSQSRTFPAWMETKTWDNRKRCLYAGNQNGGTVYEVVDDHDTLIEGVYKQYIMESAFSTEFEFSQFNETQCTIVN